MAKKDAYTTFSEGQVVAADAASTNTINLGTLQGYGVVKYNLRKLAVEAELAGAHSTADDDLTITLEKSANDSDWETLMTVVSNFDLSEEHGAGRIAKVGLPEDVDVPYLRGYYTLNSDAGSVKVNLHIIDL